MMKIQWNWILSILLYWWGFLYYDDAVSLYWDLYAAANRHILIFTGFRLVGLKPAVVAIAQATHSFLCEKDKKHLQLIRFVDINERLVVGIWQVFVKVMMNLGNEDDNEDEETLMVLKSTKILPGNNWFGPFIELLLWDLGTN